MFAFSPANLTPPLIAVASPLNPPLSLARFAYKLRRHQLSDAELGTYRALAVIASGCFFAEAYARRFNRFELTLDDLAWRNGLVRQRCEEGLQLGLVRFDAARGYLFTTGSLPLLQQYA